jgi:hypothetical protein
MTAIDEIIEEVREWAEEQRALREAAAAAAIAAPEAAEQPRRRRNIEREARLLAEEPRPLRDCRAPRTAAPWFPDMFVNDGATD